MEFMKLEDLLPGDKIELNREFFEDILGRSSYWVDKYCDKSFTIQRVEKQDIDTIITVEGQRILLLSADLEGKIKPIKIIELKDD